MTNGIKKERKPIKKELDASWAVTIVKVEDNANRNDKNIKTPKDEILFQRRVKQESSETSEIDKHRYNIRTLLQYSNATPIRTHSIATGYTCCFCKAHFSKASNLKTHTINKHDDATKNKFMQGASLFSFIVKLDITSLRCKICNAIIDGLEKLIEHLNNAHQKGLHGDIKSYIACFKLDGEEMKCHICSAEFRSFKFLLEHMNKHSTNFMCDECGAGFINIAQLRYHSDNIHTVGEYKCDSCDKVFPSSKKKYFHERASHPRTQSPKKKLMNELMQAFMNKQKEVMNTGENSKG